MRSVMFVPATKPELAAKAAHSKADVICLDLEDGVALGDKAYARANLASMADHLHAANMPFWLRVNSELELLVDDIRSLPEGTSAIMLPKTRDLTHVDLVCELLGRQTQQVNARLTALVEDAAAVHALKNDNRKPHPALAALALGTEDLAASLGAEPGSRVVENLLMELFCTASRFAVDCLGYAGSIGEFRNIDAFSKPLDAAARCGISGGLCIHPAQIDALNRSFSVNPERLLWARKVVVAFETAETGVVSVDGKMVDKPVYQQARALCRREA